VTALALIALVLLVAINGFFVAAEFALVRSRREKMEALADEGARGARLALSQMEEIDRYLSACQLGITMASIGIGFLGEPALASLFEDAIGGALGHGVAVAISFALAYAIATTLHITTGEQVPKIYSIARSEGVARRVAQPLQWFAASFRPFEWALTRISNALLRVVGVDAQSEFEEETRSEDLKMLIARGVTGGTLDPGEAGMLSGVFHLHEQEARQIMTPIPAVVTVDVSEDAQTALRRCVDSGHTRLVVTEDENTDRVKGIVHNNSLARLLMVQGPEASIEPAVKDALIVPETKPLDDLLADLQRERVSMAVVIDEYGRTSGVVTVEDIIEEVVGEIADETDPAAGAVRRLANGDLYARGHVAINDLADYGMELPVDTDAYNSVGGLVFGELGRLPKRGDMVQVDDYSLRVESVRENRVEAVRIRDHSEERNEERARQAAEEPDES
jgi:CBS domain containing-hemolysin-like protein